MKYRNHLVVDKLFGTCSLINYLVNLYFEALKPLWHFIWRTVLLDCQLGEAQVPLGAKSVPLFGGQSPSRIPAH